MMPQRKPSWKACVAKMFLNNDLEWSPTSTYPPPHDDDGYDEHHAAMGNNAPAVAEQSDLVMSKQQQGALKKQEPAAPPSTAANRTITLASPATGEAEKLAQRRHLYTEFMLYSDDPLIDIEQLTTEQRFRDLQPGRTVRLDEGNSTVLVIPQRISSRSSGTGNPRFVVIPKLRMGGAAGKGGGQIWRPLPQEVIQKPVKKAGSSKQLAAMGAGALPPRPPAGQQYAEPVSAASTSSSYSYASTSSGGSSAGGGGAAAVGSSGRGNNIVPKMPSPLPPLASLSSNAIKKAAPPKAAASSFAAFPGFAVRHM